MNEKGRPMLTGCDQFRQWLGERGFRSEEDRFRNEGNACNWYAYRRTDLAARECETNDGKRMQVVVKPFAYTRNGITHESATVEMTGEANGIWFNQQAYSIPQPVLMERFDDIERMLVRAWNALHDGSALPSRHAGL